MDEPFRSGIQTFVVDALADQYSTVVCIGKRHDGSLDIVSYARNALRQRALLYYALAMTDEMMGRGYEAQEDAAGVDG